MAKLPFRSFMGGSLPVPDKSEIQVVPLSIDPEVSAISRGTRAILLRVLWVVAGFAVAGGIVTMIGARTAHAALVARQMGNPCIVGCSDLGIDPATRLARIGGAAISAGDWVTICISGASRRRRRGPKKSLQRSSVGCLRASICRPAQSPHLRVNHTFTT